MKASRLLFLIPLLLLACTGSTGPAGPAGLSTGTISGTASDEKLGLSITGNGLSGFLSVSIGGSNQSVSLSTKGSTLKGVNITFARVG